SIQINHAVFTAYENVLEKGDYPFFILFMDIDPHKTDVNVHPNKLEVRFDDEKNIYNFVLAVIKKSLGTYDLVPSMMFTEVTSETEKIKVDNYARSRNDFSDRPNFNSRLSVARTDFSDKDIDLIFSSVTNDITKPLQRSEEHTSELQSRENLVCRLLLEKKKKKLY